jgi:hypothetical protein
MSFFVRVTIELEAEPIHLKRRHDIQHNDIQHNDTQHNDTQHNDIQHNDTQHEGLVCDTQHKRYSA